MGDEHWYASYIRSCDIFYFGLTSFQEHTSHKYILITYRIYPCRSLATRYPSIRPSFFSHPITQNPYTYKRTGHLNSILRSDATTPHVFPRYGRDLKYNKSSAEALIPAVGVNENGYGEVFRLNLEVGRFLRAYEVDVGGDDLTSSGAGALQGGIGTGSVNTAAIAEESHNLLAFGSSTGGLEFWDARSRDRVGLLPSPVRPDALDGKQEITALEFDRTGLGLATGSSTGLIHLYDLRSPNPVLKKDQGYGYPIQDIVHLSSSTSRPLPDIRTQDSLIRQENY